MFSPESHHAADPSSQKKTKQQKTAGAKALLLPSSPVQPSANFRKHGPPKKKPRRRVTLR
jgi:hypothetical protein